MVIYTLHLNKTMKLIERKAVKLPKNLVKVIAYCTAFDGLFWLIRAPEGSQYNVFLGKLLLQYSTFPKQEYHYCTITS